VSINKESSEYNFLVSAANSTKWNAENSMLLGSKFWGLQVLDPNLWSWSKIT